MSWFSKKIKKIAKNDPTAKLHVKALNKAGLGSGNTLRRIADPLSIQQEKIQKGAPITSRTMFDPGNELQEDPNPAKRAALQQAAGYQQGFDTSANVPIPGVTGPVTPLPGGPSQPPPQIMPGYTPFRAQGPYGQQAVQMAGLLGQGQAQNHMMPTYGLLGQSPPQMQTPAVASPATQINSGGGGMLANVFRGFQEQQLASGQPVNSSSAQFPTQQPPMQPQPMAPQQMGMAPRKAPYLWGGK